MFLPAIVTASASGLSRAPLHDLARRRRHVFLDVFLDVVARRLVEAALQVVDHAFERRFVVPRRARCAIRTRSSALCRCRRGSCRRVVGHVLDRRRRLHAARAQHAFDLLQIVRVHRREAAAADRLRPRHDRAVGDRLRAIGNHFPRIDLDLHAETAARRARAVRRVEREQPRLELLEREAAVRARERFAERQLACCFLRAGSSVQHGDDAGREPQRRLDRVGQALANVRLHHQPVDDDLDRVLLLLVELDLLAQFFDLAVDADAREALFARLPRTASRTRPCGRGSTGASSWMRVPSGSSMIWSTICSLDCAADFAAAVVAVRRRRCARRAGAGSRRSR